MPVVDRIAADYLEKVTFLAVAGRAPLDRTEAQAAELFSTNLLWGLDDSIWDLYGVFGQPYSVLVDAGGAVVDAWYGALPETELRARIEALAATAA